MKKSKFSLNSLMKNNNFLFILALVISLSIWVYMSFGNANDTTLTLTNIPIQTELSADAQSSGLRIFSSDEQTASVTVSGNRTVLGSIKEKDITVTAAANSINSSGRFALPVAATKTTPSSNFQIISTVTPSTINVLVDYFRESTFQIQDNHVVYKVADGYYGFTALSSKTIVISGPQTEISKIEKVNAVAEISGVLDKTTTVDARIVLYDKNNEVLSTDLLKMDMTSVKATITVLPEKTVQVRPVFVNKPDGLKITDDMITVEPSSILLAGPSKIIESTDFVNLEPIDFQTLTNDKKSFPSLGIDIPNDCKNLSNSTSAKVTLDLSKLSTKKITVDKITTEGLSKDYTAEITQNSITVTVVGLPDDIEKLSKSDITAIIDASDSVGKIGSVQMPVTFKFKNVDSCWAYGDYKANLTINEK